MEQDPTEPTPKQQMRRFLDTIKSQEGPDPHDYLKMMGKLKSMYPDLKPEDVDKTLRDWLIGGPPENNS